MSIDIKTIIVNLKVIGKLNTGIKLNTKNKYFSLDVDRKYQGAIRLARGDGRDFTYDRISALIVSLMDIIKLEDKTILGYIDEKEFNMEVRECVEKAVTGLTSFKETYCDDLTFISKIEFEITRLNRVLKGLVPVSVFKDDATINEDDVTF